MGPAAEHLTKRRKVDEAFHKELAEVSRLLALVPLGDFSSQTSAGRVTSNCASNSGSCTSDNFIPKVPEGPPGIMAGC